MKKLCAILLLTAAGVLPAMAADLPVKAVPAAPSAYGDLWSGFYLGAHAGYGFNVGGGDAVAAVPLSGVNVSVPQGFVGGIHGGYGQRFNNIFYAGLEGDADISAINAGGNGLITATSKNQWLASARARLGVILGPALLYGTGGWGWSGGEFTITSPISSNSMSPTMDGFVWGGGLEVPFSPNWLGRVEYLQYDFGSVTVAGPVASFTTSNRVEVVRAGLSYKF